MSEDNSDAQRNADELVIGLGKLVGIEGMALSAQGRCDLVFDDQPLSICYYAETGFLSLEAPVMEIPSSPSDRFYSWVLEANLASFVYGHGCLALAPQGGHIMWLDRMSAKGLEQSEFQDWLHRSIERAEFWARELPERSNSAELAKPATEESWTGDEFVLRA